MSFVTSIRDYAETLNAISQNLGSDFTTNRFVSETAIYLLKTLQTSFFYIVSFQWIRDFTLLPIVLPKLSASVFKETFFLDTPSHVLFDFLEIPDFSQNKFFLGVFNSFFLSLPFSVIHIIAVRRLLIQGIPSGIYTLGGYIVGQVLFLACTIFGIRQILIPWLTLEPLTFVLGFSLIIWTIYSMVGEPLKELKGWFLSQYKTFFLTSFLLAWCEQTSVFQYLGNITASSNVTILESFSSTSPISSFFSHFLYLFGILTGSILFTCLWGLFFLQVKNLYLVYTPTFLSSFIQFVNKATFVLALSFSLTSIPFYGFDYLFTGPLGFVSQDVLFENTIFETRNSKTKPTDIRLSDRDTNYQQVHLEFSAFDRGEYGREIPGLSFEDLNYRGDFAWTGRGNNQDITDTRGSIFSLSKLFKKKSDPSITASQKMAPSLIEQRNQLFKERAFDNLWDDPEMNSEVLERLKELYPNSALEGNSEDSILNQEHYQIIVNSFSNDELRETTDPQNEQNIERKVKNKYYSNPIFKALLSMDIDLFLNRQPQNFQISPEQEIDLYNKREILESYSNSLRDYSNLPYSETFETIFDGAKSFSNKVYNQQFKGTLRSVRRWFSLTCDPQDCDERILKFDQPLYDFSPNQQLSVYHEELNNRENQSQNDALLQPEKIDFSPRPLYAGWDERLRKFVITNKLLPRRLAGYQVSGDPEILRNFSSTKSNNFKSSRKIKFTTWPVSENQIEQKTVPYTVLYQITDEDTRARLGPFYKTLPSNFERYLRSQPTTDGTKLDQFESLEPKRGGFIWPGNTKLNFPFFSK